MTVLLYVSALLVCLYYLAMTAFALSSGVPTSPSGKGTGHRSQSEYWGSPEASGTVQAVVHDAITQTIQDVNSPFSYRPLRAAHAVRSAHLHFYPIGRTPSSTNLTRTAQGSHNV